MWMLTGDKLETAENIALSCRLIQMDMSISKISDPADAKVDAFLTNVHDTIKLCH